MRGDRRAVAVLALGFLAAACGDLLFSADVLGRRPFQPPPAYAEWWAATETCSVRQAPMQRVSWFLADGLAGDGVIARARWTAPHEIIIVKGYEDDERVVRHEMLHDLLQGDRLHQSDLWHRCGLRFDVVDGP